MFRTLGLRHLCVINRHNQILGIVTRQNLVAAHHFAVNAASSDSLSPSSSSGRERRDKGRDRESDREGGEDLFQMGPVKKKAASGSRSRELDVLSPDQFSFDSFDERNMSGVELNELDADVGDEEDLIRKGNLSSMDSFDRRKGRDDFGEKKSGRREILRQKNKRKEPYLAHTIELKFTS